MLNKSAKNTTETGAFFVASMRIAQRNGVGTFQTVCDEKTVVGGELDDKSGETQSRPSKRGSVGRAGRSYQRTSRAVESRADVAPTGNTSV